MRERSSAKHVSKAMLGGSTDPVAGVTKKLNGSFATVIIFVRYLLTKSSESFEIQRIRHLLHCSDCVFQPFNSADLKVAFGRILRFEARTAYVPICAIPGRDPQRSLHVDCESSYGRRRNPTETGIDLDMRSREERRWTRPFAGCRCRGRFQVEELRHFSARRSASCLRPQCRTRSDAASHVGF